MVQEIRLELVCPVCGTRLTDTSPQMCWDSWELMRIEMGINSELLSYEKILEIIPKRPTTSYTLHITIEITED